MVNMKKRLAVAAVLALGLLACWLRGRADMPGRSILKGAAVEYLFPEQVTVAAGKASEVALHFRIAQGLHINSHTPKDEFLIPTTFSIPDGSGVRLDKATYPAGRSSRCRWTLARSSASTPASSRFRRALWPRPAITWLRASCATRPAIRTRACRRRRFRGDRCDREVKKQGKGNREQGTGRKGGNWDFQGSNLELNLRRMSLLLLLRR